MVEQSEWAIVFYRDERGSSPVREFLQGLDDEVRASMGWAIDQLRLRNVRAGMPLVRHLEGDLWELRRESRTNIYRLIYFFFRGRRIVFVHGFQKKSQKMPRRELEIARLRQATFMQREGGA